MDESGRHILHEFMTGQRPKPKHKWVNGALWTLIALLLAALIYLLVGGVVPQRAVPAVQPQQSSSLLQLQTFDRVGAAVIATLAALALADQAHAASRPSADQCHASELVSFIGKPVAELQQMQLPDARFVCDRCAATADVRASRLTVIYSEKSNRITRLKCE